MTRRSLRKNAMLSARYEFIDRGISPEEVMMRIYMLHGATIKSQQSSNFAILMEEMKLGNDIAIILRNTWENNWINIDRLISKLIQQ